MNDGDAETLAAIRARAEAAFASPWGSAAEMVADTELARAMTSASMTTYLQANIPTLVYFAADDERECVRCQENEDVGEIPIGGDWPNGFPPVHPLCRCAIGPGFGTSDAQFAGGDAEEG